MDRPDFALIEQRLGESPSYFADLLNISTSTWRKLKRGETWNKGVPPEKEQAVRLLIERAGLNGQVKDEPPDPGAIIVNPATVEPEAAATATSEPGPKPEPVGPKTTHAESKAEQKPATTEAELPTGFNGLPDEGDKNDAKAKDEAEAEAEAEADAFTKIREELDLWHAADGADEVSFATVTVSKTELGEPVLEHFKVRSKAFKKWLRTRLLNLGEMPKRDTLKDMIDTIEALAVVEGDERKAHRRTGRASDGSLWIDLGRRDRQVVRIDEDGWEVVPMTAAAPLMVTTDAMAALPEPTDAEGLSLDTWLIRHLNLHGTDDSEEAIAEGQRHARFTAAFCVAAIRPEPPYWHLQLVGEQGSAKTTAARLIKRIIDPSALEDMAPPKTHHDLAVVAKEQRVTSLDNLSKMSPEMSDALARMSTGSTIANRGLYTDGEVAAFSVRGACLLNGIPDVISKADLAERTLTLVLQRPTRRKLDAEVTAGFKEDWPKVLAALCNGLVGVLAYHQDVIGALDRERAPRMVDPFVWAEAAGRVWDWKPWQLLEDIEHAQYDAAASLMESDSVARAVIKAITDWCKRKKQPEWKGQAKELLNIARIAAQDLGASMEYFPTSPRGMASSMRRIAPPLRLLGWTVDNQWDGRDKDRAPRWTLRPPKS